MNSSAQPEAAGPESRIAESNVAASDEPWSPGGETWVQDASSQVLSNATPLQRLLSDNYIAPTATTTSPHLGDGGSTG